MEGPTCLCRSWCCCSSSLSLSMLTWQRSRSLRRLVAAALGSDSPPMGGTQLRGLGLGLVLGLGLPADGRDPAARHSSGQKNASPECEGSTTCVWQVWAVASTHRSISSIVRLSRFTSMSYLQHASEMCRLHEPHARYLVDARESLDLHNLRHA